VSLLLLCLACLLCLSTSSGVRFAAAQGTASSGAKTCNLGVWMTTPAPTVGFDVVYPNNSIAYVRHNYTLPPESFFIAHWYVGIIIIVVVVCGAYILLGLWVCYHFEFCDQRKAKKVVEESYVTKGYFDIDRYVDRSDGYSGNTSSAAETEEWSNNTRSFVASGSYDDSYDNSYSDDYGSSSPSASDEDDGVVAMNPLRF
jgi:hypothetical protein